MGKNFLFSVGTLLPNQITDFSSSSFFLKLFLDRQARKVEILLLVSSLRKNMQYADAFKFEVSVSDWSVCFSISYEYVKYQVECLSDVPFSFTLCLWYYVPTSVL